MNGSQKIIQKFFFTILHRSQVGRCNKRESFKRQQNLRKAMDQARKLVNNTPTPGTHKKIPVTMIAETTASSLMELLKDITEETEQCSDQHSKKPLGEGEIQFSVFPAVTTTEQL
jgi:hypothetical protein